MAFLFCSVPEQWNQIGNPMEPQDTAAIVCEHIAKDRAPILLAKRLEPENESDSGWQFLCGAPDENWQSAQVWALHEVLAYDGTISGLIDLPVGTVLTRSLANQKWKITRGESD